MGEGIFAQSHAISHLRHCSNAGLKEGIGINANQITQLNSSNTGRRTETILPHINYTGQINSIDLNVVRECALSDDAYLRTTELIGIKQTPQDRRNSNQSLFVSRHNDISRLNLVGLIAGGDLKGIDLGITESEGTNIIDIGANGDLIHLFATIEHTLGQNGSIHIEALKRSTADEGISTVLNLLCGNLHILQILTAGKSILTNGQQTLIRDDTLQLLIACKGIVGNHTGTGEINGTTQVAVLKGTLVNDKGIVITIVSDLLQRSTAVECTIFNGFQGRRQNNFLQSSQVCESIAIDLGNTLRNDNLSNGIITNVPLLRHGRVVNQHFIRRFGDVIEVGECKCTNFLQGKIRRNGNQTTITIVMVQNTGIGNIGILNFNGNCLRVIGRLSIQHNTNGNGSKAFLLCSNNTILRNRYNILVTTCKAQSCIVGEIGIQFNRQSNGFRRIHGQGVSAVEETNITGITQLLVFTVDHIISLQRCKACNLKDIGNRLIKTTVAFIPFFQNRDFKCQLSVGNGITNLNSGSTRAGSNQLIVDHTDNAGLRTAELQQFSPLSIGISVRLQGIYLIGAQNQTLFQAIEIEINVIIGQTNLKGSHIQSVVINSQNEGVLVHGLVLNGVNVVSQLVGNIGSAVALRIHRCHIIAEHPHGRSGITIIILTHVDVTQLGSHGEVVIIDTNLGIQTVLLQGLIILIGELNIGNGGSLKVDDQRELENIVLVGLQTAIAIIHVANQTNGVLGIVGQIVLGGIEVDLHVGRINRTAITVRLTNIVINGFINHFAGSIIGNSNNDLSSITQQTGPNKAQRVDRTLLIGQCNEVAICGNDNVTGVLNEIVRAQEANVVLGDTTDGTGSVSVRHGLIFRIDTIVQLISISGIVVQVHQRSLGPVAIECQIRNVHVNIRTGSSLQGNEALDIHTILKRVVQILLIGISQSDFNSNLGLSATAYSNILTAGSTTGNRNQLDGSLQCICLFCNGSLTGIGQVLADTLGQNITTDVIRQRSRSNIMDNKSHLINASLIGIVAQLKLGLVHQLTVPIVGAQVSLRVQAVGQVSKTRALLTNSIRQAVGVQSDVSSGHHQLIDQLIDLHIIISNAGEILNDILTQQDNHTSQVGASHGSTGQAIITATGNRRQNVTTVGSNFRLDIQAGSRTPGGEVRNERTRGLVNTNAQLTTTGSSQHFTISLGNGANCQLGIANVHLDITGNVVVNDDTGSTLSFSNHRLFLEGVGTTTNQGNLALHVKTGIVSATTDTGNNYKFNFLTLLVSEQCLNKIQFLCRCVIGLVKVHDAVAVLQIRSFLTVDGGNGHNTLVSTGRTNRTGIGVGGQRQVTVFLRTKGGRIAVGSSNNHRDASLTQLIIHAIHNLLIRLTSKATSSTQRHVDHINAQDYTILQSGQDPTADSRIINIGENLHGHQLCIGCNTGNGVILTDNNTGNVGTVVIVSRVNVRIVIGVVIAEGNLFVDVHIVCSQASIHLVSNGIANQCSNLIIGQAQLGGGEVLGRECGMIGIKTGIQNCNNHAAAIVSAAGTVENTGIVNINLIFNQLGFTLFINLADDNALSLYKRLTGSIKVTGGNGNLKTTKQSVVSITGGVSNLLVIQLS